jgi:hypothetical protein
MSVIDRALQAQRPDLPVLTLREAAATLLVAAAAADGGLSPEEGDRLNAVLSSMRLYRSAPAEHLQHLLDNAIGVVARSGAETVLPACAAVIPDELRAPVFALAAELVFVDGRITGPEKAFIDALQTALAVDDTTALKIVEVLLIRNRA